MKAIKKFGSKRQIVVFDKVGDTIPTGVHVDITDAKARFSDGVIPAGTLLVKGSGDGKVKVLNEALSASNVTKDKAVGLTIYDIEIDDYPLVSAVVEGIVRIEALPDKEKTGLKFIKDALPRITFY
ncbi:hypothetical protein ACT8O7_08050 [Ornithobacterium rhinotracheale]|uniref:hypothetical protein n=1 Tax=Ornithobacterium rhinotracheale TaxID=28251 RepID=UPI0040371E50